jgi:Trk K+ transport system NAD-binding subunit
VVTGDVDNRVTYDRLRVPSARLVFANAEDTTNTNIALTVREVDAEVPILALAEDDDSIDILELSGATHVLPLKHRLGEHLAARVSSGSGFAHVVGRFRDLLLVEFVVHGTKISGKALAETRLRELTGVNVVGVWEHGRLRPVHAEFRLADLSVPMAVGTKEQIERLNGLLGDSGGPGRPVLVIGGGKVGRATAAALHRRGLAVHIVDKEERLRSVFGSDAERVVVGDAADREVLLEAGLEDAGSVVLTTNDDAMNIYLSVYCRRLKPDLNIVSRITHERNIEAIYRAGADFVLGYASLGREHVVSLLLGREPIMIGEGADFFVIPVPGSLAGKTLGESQIGARTGLIVMAIEEGHETRTNPRPSMALPKGGRLMVLGTADQRQAFSGAFD